MTTLAYATLVRPLTQNEGGGYLAAFPDIPGCDSDDNTPEEALQDAELAHRAKYEGSHLHTFVATILAKYAGSFSSSSQKRPRL